MTRYDPLHALLACNTAAVISETVCQAGMVHAVAAEQAGHHGLP